MKNELTIGKITAEHISQLSKAGIIPQNTPAAQVQIFAQVCREKGISPFQKHIYLLSYKTKGGTKYQTIMGIDGFRHIAGMTGAHAGTEITYNGGKSIDQVKQSGETARTALCVVKKIMGNVIAEFSHEVSMEEFQKKERYTNKWDTMPFQMLGKCAEAFALKKGFPEHLSGLHIPEEKAAFENTNVPTEEAVEVDQKEVFEQACDEVDKRTTSTELAQQASFMINDAKAKGLDANGIERLKEYITETHKNLKNG